MPARASTMCSRNSALRGIEPVEVLDQRHRRLLPRWSLWITWRMHADELALARLGIEARRRALRVADAEEVEEQRQRLGEALVEQHHAPGDLLARAAVVVRRSVMPK